jgi:hypothetical protein
MEVLVNVSLGELIDKITILNIKQQRISDVIKLVNVEKELKVLTENLHALNIDNHKLASYTARLQDINQQLWDIEDEIREQELQKNFGDKFIELARAVYVTNDQRAAIKKEINLAFGSDLVEEKSYKEY